MHDLCLAAEKNRGYWFLMTLKTTLTNSCRHAFLTAIFSMAAVAIAGPAPQPPGPLESILTRNVVDLTETIMPQGFVHPGISCNAETLSVMREKVLAGVSPWVDCFEGMRRTRYANLNQRPRLVSQITNDGGIGGFGSDAQLMWVHTILYVVTGNEDYRKIPVEIINWYGARTNENFFPTYFSDSHIKIGKHVNTFCAAVDILRATLPKDESLAVTQEMVDALQKNCLHPIRKTCIERNDYFMNQHSYAIVGFLASTILGDEVEDYKRAVEWVTVNATSPNQGRNGAIKQQIRLVTRNDATGEAVEPNLQLIEMGRDMPHADGNINYLMTMSKAIDFQKTKVDPVAGTVTDRADGVSPFHFLDDRLPKGAALYAKYNLGYGLKWIPTYSETDPNQTDCGARYDYISPRGRGSFGSAYHYYQLKGLGIDLETGPCRFVKVAFDATAAGHEWVRSGGYLDSVHNYGFDFWIGLPAAASDAAPDPSKAERALAKVVPPLEVTYNGAPVVGQQIEYQFVDLSAHAQPGDIYPGSPDDVPLKVQRDADGTGYVRMTIEKSPRTMIIPGHFPRGSGLRVRSDSFVKLSFYNNEVAAMRGGGEEKYYVPDTKGEWLDVITDVEGNGLLYVQAESPAEHALIDFDRIDTDTSAVRRLTFGAPGNATAICAFAGESVHESFAVTGGMEGVTYRALDIPAGATVDPATGTLSWTPAADQAGDHAVYVIARAGDYLRTLRVDLHVARDPQAVLDYVARAYDPGRKYVASTEQALRAAMESRDRAAVKRAVEGLELVNPRLPDGTLDYRVASGPPERITNIKMMADNDPFTWGGIWGFDKNITLDFGKRFKVKAEAFRMQPRDGHPSRMKGAVVYGSNDRKHWVLLTEKKTVSSPDMQALAVKEEERNKPYRYIRLFMPARELPIFEVAEFRIIGERIQDYSPDYCVAYIKGYDDGTFRPDQKLTKAEAVSWLAGLVDDYTDKGVYTCGFADVPKDAPCYDDVAYMSSRGIGNTWTQAVKYVTADANNLFHPDAPITRGELAAIMARMQWLTGDGPALADVTADKADAADIRRAVREGWFTTDESGAFRPDAPVTRAEFVVAANRMIGRTELPHANLPSFSDVPPAHPAYAEIMKAATTYAITE